MSPTSSPDLAESPAPSAPRADPPARSATDVDQARPTPWVRIGGLVAMLAVALAALLTMFVWPAANSSVHDIPLAVAGPQDWATGVEQQLTERLPGDFDTRRYQSPQQAREAVRDRSVYGAIVSTPDGLEILVATGAGPAVAQSIAALRPALVAGTANPGDPPVSLVDVAPPAEGDQRGGGIAAAVLPLSMAGTAAANLMIFLVSGHRRRLAATALAAVMGGLVVASVLQSWLAVVDGSFASVAAAAALGLFAMSAALIGLHARFGRAGLGVGGAAMVLVGNPLAGQSTAPDMLPGVWGDVGQLLPPGAIGALLRAQGFFDGSGSARPLLVLSTWATFGAVLWIAAVARGRRTSTER